MTINSYGKPFLAPGAYENLSFSEYQADPCERPSFNFSIGKILLEKPPLYAWLAHPKLNPDWQPPPWDRRLDEGELVHSGLLGPGRDYVVADYPDYRTKEAREWRDSIVASGKIPILKKANTKISQCIEAVSPQLPFSPNCPTERVYIFEHDGVLCRARIDAIEGCVYDIKTVENLSDSHLINQIENFKYDMQAAFYLLATEATVFKWVFVEINFPFQMRTIIADKGRLDIGARKYKYALDKWRGCMGMNTWPGYPQFTEHLPYPQWAEARWLEREIAESE